MDNTFENERLLLHACCGPCSLEPVRVLRENGCEPHIYYANSNIAPSDEYERRLTAIRQWAAEEGVEFIEGSYEPGNWADEVGGPWVRGEFAREDRCRACYRLRFEESAAYAAAHGYTALGTTLSISPYQFTDIIREELERACEARGLECAFEDWRPYYSEATRRSRDKGMYRQKYCGCGFSAAESEEERLERKAARDALRAERAEARAEEEALLEQRRQKRRAYDAKRARQRAILKSLRNS